MTDPVWARRLEILENLDTFRHLPPNWDSYGGVAPSEGTVKTALGIVQELTRLLGWSVSPGGDGSITIDCTSIYGNPITIYVGPMARKEQKEP